MLWIKKLIDKIIR